MAKHEVIVYSSTGCPYCEKVKSFLKENQIEFEERNASIHKEYFDQLKERKIYGTPATLINGKLVLGFQEKKFNKLLGLSEDPVPVVSNSQPAASQENADSIFQSVNEKVLEEVYDFVTIGGGPA